MRNLIEHIMNDDYVSATDVFESRLNDLVEKKLYEFKRSIDISEIVKPDPNRPGQFIGANTKADWSKYRKQNKSIKWDQNKEGKKVAEKPKAVPLGHGGKLSASDIKARRKAGYLQAHPAIKSMEFIDAVVKHLEKKKNIKESDATTPFVRRAQERAARASELAGAGETPLQRAQSFQSQAKPEPETPSPGLSPEHKKLKSRSAGRETGERYADALARARRLEARGRAGSVAKVKSAYRGYRMKTAAKSLMGRAGGAVAGAAGRVAGEISSYSNLEE